MTKRKICVVTGTRAEYGLLYWLMKEIQAEPSLELQLIVTGMHLSPEFGLTYKEIEKEFHIDKKIEMLLSSDTSVGISKSMGLAQISFAEAYDELKPDLIVLLGDRYEIFSAASAALISKIPVAHLSGGELTEGAFDDALRHCITKMSQIHFTAIEEYRKRVIQLGENPKHVYNVGEAGLDNIRRLKLLSKTELESALNFKLMEKNYLITFHPATLETDTPEQQLQNLLTVLATFKDTRLIFTKANSDTGGRIINRMIDDFVLKHPNSSIAFTSLGQLRYLSLMRYVDAVVGNSSSGIVEAPSFKIGTINIGNRQLGRIRPASVIDCNTTTESIRNAFLTLNSPGFKKGLSEIVNPYGDGNSSKEIVRILKKIDLNNLIKKSFYDIEDMSC